MGASVTHGNGAVPASPAIVDHVVHDLVTIRLVSPPGSVIDQLRCALGPSRGSPARDADITLMFVDDLPVRGQLRFLGLNQAAFDDNAFYVVDARGRRIQIDFESLGDRCDLLCERGVAAVPFLHALVSLCLLAKGHVLFHSSGFLYEEKATLVAGWQKGGKTEMLLAFMAAGGTYLSDEWTIVSPDDGTVRGLPGVAQVWDWQFRCLPEYWSRIRRSDRFRLRTVRAYQRVYRRVPDGVWMRLPGAGFLHRLSLEGGVAELGQARVSPEVLFHDRISEAPVRVERLFFATVARGKTSVLPIDSREVADRMAASLAYERRALDAAYHQFRFAFPRRRSELLAGAVDRERGLLKKAFSGASAYEVRHPYPVSLNELYDVTLPYVIP